MELGSSVLPSTAPSAVGAGGTSRALGVTLWECGDGAEEHAQGGGPELSELFSGTPKKLLPKTAFSPPRIASSGECGARCALQQRCVSFLLFIKVGVYLSKTSGSSQ